MKAFYVDLVRGAKIAWLAGPFPDEPTARKYERAAVAKANEIDPWTHFDAYGVTSFDADIQPAGKLNHLIDIDPKDLLPIVEKRKAA